jgi:hypothetical protein
MTTNTTKMTPEETTAYAALGYVERRFRRSKGEQFGRDADWNDGYEIGVIVAMTEHFTFEVDYQELIHCNYENLESVLARLNAHIDTLRRERLGL